MALESKVFFEVVKKHGLVSEKQLQNLEKAIQKDKLSQADLDTLVSKNYLTKWQVSRLLTGKHNFTVGQFTLLDYVGKDDFGEVYLVRSKSNGANCRLRLVAKAISGDAEKIKPYLDRVRSFQSIKNPGLTRVLQTAEVGGRHIVVSSLPTGKSAASDAEQSPPTNDSIGTLVHQVSNVVSDLHMADLEHGSIQASNVRRSDNNGWSLDLPRDIGFAKPENAAESDVAALAGLAGWMLTKSSDASSPDAKVLSEKLNSLAANPAATLDDLKNTFPAGAEAAVPTVVGAEAVVVEPEVVEPEVVEPELVEPELVEPEVVEPEIAEPQPVTGSPGIQLAESVGSGIVGPASVEKVDPAELAGIVISTEPKSTNEAVVAGQEGAAVEAESVEAELVEPELVEPELVEPEIVAANVAEVEQLAADLPSPLESASGGLESIEKQDDVFGDFDQVEVVSEIQTPVNVAMPVVVEGAANAAMPMSPQPQPAQAATEDEETEAKPRNNKMLVLAAAGGGGLGVVILGLVIFFLTRGNGDSNDKQLASNDNSAKTKSDDTNEKADPKKEAKDENSTKGMVQKELKSSGLFKGIGAFNKNNPAKKTEGTDPDKSKTNVGKQAPNDAKKNPNANNKQGSAGNQGKTDSNKADPDAGKGGGAKSTDTNPGKTTQNTDPKNQKPKTDQKQPGKKPGDDKGKDDKGKDSKAKDDAKDKGKSGDDAVLLIGAKKNDDDKKEEGSNSSKLANPFAESPGFVDLTPAKKGDNNTAFQKLLPLKIPPSLPLTVMLHGGDHASKSKISFELKASTSENATWIVSAGTANQTTPIGRFHFDGQDFGYQWEAGAEDLSNSIYLINCALRIQAAQYKHELALRSPSVSTLLDFSKSISPKGDAKLENAPNMEYVKIALVNLPDNFPKFDYPKGKDFLVDRADSIKLAFKKENIDVLQCVFGSRQRGSKMAVNLDFKYVTVDKQFQPMTTMDKFEKVANSVITEAETLEARLDQLDTEYKKLKDKNQQGEFDRVTGRRKLSEQVTVARRYKNHFQNTLEMVKAIYASKVGFRIYYQAGEIEVDLATPDGKKYSRPSPAPANGQNAKAKDAKTKDAKAKK